MSPADILAIIAAAQQLVSIAVKQRELLQQSDQASVDAALATLRATSDAMHENAQKI